jgi:hypothetical protein
MKNIKNCSALLGVLTFASIYLPPLSAQGIEPSSIGADFRIRHHEPLNSLRFMEQSSKADSPIAAQASIATTVSLKAFGKKFNLELEPNDSLLDNLPIAQKHRLKQSMQIYKGRIAGMTGSWARINRTVDHVSGAFWDGKELYIIDRSDDVGKAIAGGQLAKAASKPYSLIYKLSETESNATCAIDPKAKPFKNFQGLVKELKGRVPALAQATGKLDVAIVTDAQFTQANSSNPQAAVVARMNVVDGIYSEQVGIHINVSEIRALTANGTLNSTSATTLLTQFSDFASSPGFNNPGIAHLFTGRDMVGNTVGIAYIGALCLKDYGVGVSQTNGTGTAGALTIAHEMGHNFGAPHDNQNGSACAGTPGTFIMNPSLNGSTQFSPCSLQKMTPNIASAACIANATITPKADVRPVFPVNPINATVSRKFNYRVEVRNGGTGVAQNSTARITLPSALTVNAVAASVGQCTKSANLVNCKLGALAANAVRTITINLKSGTKPVNLVSSVQVAASTDSNTTNNRGGVAIRVR